VEPPVERLVRAGPEVPEQADRLLEERAADVEPVEHPDVRELAAFQPIPSPAHDAAVAQRVERRELLGDDDRVAHGEDDHARSESDPGVLAPTHARVRIAS
jgi:hypothetical protein